MKRAIRLNANICLLSNPLKHCGNAGLSMKEKLYLRAFATRATATHNGWIWKGSENLSHPLSNCSRKEDWRGRYKSKQADRYTWHAYSSQELVDYSASTWLSKPCASM